MTVTGETEVVFGLDRSVYRQFRALADGPKRAPTASEVIAARERLDMDQATFAALIGVPVDRLREWEAGIRKVMLVRDRYAIWWASALTKCPFCHQPIDPETSATLSAAWEEP